MNQGIAFSRTLRALEAADFRGSKIGFVAAVLLLAAWTWWMFAGRVPQYETTSIVRIESGRALAYFPPAAIARLHPGQRAIIHFGSEMFPAQVQSVASDHVELLASSQKRLATASIPGTADIEVARLSPAAIALRAIGHQ